MLKLTMEWNRYTKNDFLNLSKFKVSLNRDISYDNSLDQVVGPHGKANVLNIRGVFTKFMIPVYYDYDHVMDSKEFLEVVEKIQGFGYHVIGITVDNYSSNRTLANQLGVTNDNPKFPNPSKEYEGEYIYFLFDIVHSLKLLRSHFVDQGKV